MNISIDLPSELEKKLSTEASQLKLSLTEYIVQILSLRTSPSSTPKTGAELVAYWENVGVIDSRSDIINSQEYARKLRHEAETRKLI